MIVSKKLGFVIADLYFNEALFSGSAAFNRVDIVRYISWPEPVPRAQSDECWTILINLGKDEIIWKGFDKTARNSVRRAERENVRCELVSRPEWSQISLFANFYDAFAATKALAPISRQRLEWLSKSNALALSWASVDEQEIAVWHAYIQVGRRARLLHSASLFRDVEDKEKRNAISRANCLLHWRDLIAFRERGLCVLDLGGWDHTGSEVLKPINAFKVQFGGDIVREFNAVVPKSWAASALLGLNRFRSGPYLKAHNHG